MSLFVRKNWLQMSPPAFRRISERRPQTFLLVLFYFFSWKLSTWRDVHFFLVRILRIVNLITANQHLITGEYNIIINGVKLDNWMLFFQFYCEAYIIIISAEKTLLSWYYHASEYNCRGCQIIWISSKFYYFFRNML